jgi:hypothetical protein
LIKVALAGWNEGARPQDAPDIPFDKKLLAVAVEEAHKAGFKIACHANDPTSCRIAAQDLPRPDHVSLGRHALLRTCG